MNALAGKENTGVAASLVNALKAGSTETIASLKTLINVLPKPGITIVSGDYTVQPTDAGKAIVYSGGNPVLITLPATMPAGKAVRLVQDSTGATIRNW